MPMFPFVCLQCIIIIDRATALSRECARSQPSDERTPPIAPPHTVARVNLCVLWVGCQLSLLGGRKPIATTLCDRRRANITSCASRESRNLRSAIVSPGIHHRLSSRCRHEVPGNAKKQHVLRRLKPPGTAELSGIVKALRWPRRQSPGTLGAARIMSGIAKGAFSAANI